MSRVTARETLFHPGVGREGAEPGTPEWAQHHMVSLVSDVGHVADDLRRFAIYLDTMVRGEAWKVLRRKDGGLGFESASAWVEAPQPFGLGTPVDELLRRLDLVAEGKLVKAALRKGAPSPSVFIGQPRPLSAEKTWERPKEDAFVAPEPHPMAGLFQMLPDSGLRALADDIVANGQREPIVLWEGKILDGRNRLAACNLANVMPVFKDLAHCPDPVAYVLSANLHRRHLTDDDRALCAAQMKPHYQERAAKAHAEGVKTGGRGKRKVQETLDSDESRVSRNRWFDLASVDWHISTGAIQRADSILSQRDALPELHDAVKVTKTVSLSSAATLAKATRDGVVSVEEVKEAVASKDASVKLANKIRDAKPKRPGKGGGGKGAPPTPTVAAVPPAADSIDQAAAMLGVERGTVEAATLVLKHGIPELIDAVERGRMDVYVAATLAMSPADEQLAAVRASNTATRHPALVAIDTAADLDALGRALTAANADASLTDKEEVGAAYQKRCAVLREQSAVTPTAPAPVSTQAAPSQPKEAAAPASRQLSLVDEEEDYGEPDPDEPDEPTVSTVLPGESEAALLLTQLSECIRPLARQGRLDKFRVALAALLAEWSDS